MGEENKLDGWVKIYRSLTGKGWYMNSKYVHLWTHLLLKANHKDRELMFNGENITVKEGQFLTGRKQLSKETGLSETTIERVLNFFEKNEHQIGQQKTNKNRLITIRNWELYQGGGQQNGQQTDNKRTTNGHKQELKNVKNERISFVETSMEFQLSRLLLSLIRERKPDLREPNLQEWARQVDLMVRIDKRDPDRIGQVIRWCQVDDFWQNNILSTKKLRRQFDQLSLKMMAGGGSIEDFKPPKIRLDKETGKAYYVEEGG